MGRRGLLQGALAAGLWSIFIRRGTAAEPAVKDMKGVEEIARALHAPASGARFFVIKVKAENPPRSLPPRDAVHIKNRFRAHLGLGTM